MSTYLGIHGVTEVTRPAPLVILVGAQWMRKHSRVGVTAQNDRYFGRNQVSFEMIDAGLTEYLASRDVVPELIVGVVSSLGLLATRFS